MPGVKDWHLAPVSMLWEGRSEEQICEQMKDPARNGSRRTGAQVIEHMKTDPLVLWAWAPGRRTTPPLSHEKFVEALEAWVQAGMPCRRTLFLAIPMLLGAACAAIQRFEVRDMERMLMAAGFRADTPELQGDLRSIPPYRIVSRTKDRNVVYMYADPDNCHCVYVGGNKEYSEYERLRVEREITQRTAGRAGGAP